MNKLWFKSISKTVGRFVHERGPDILLGAGIAGVFLTVGEAISATVRATEKVKKYEAENDISVSELEPVEKAETVAKVVWKDYIPTMISLTGTTTMLILSGKKYRKQNAAIAAAYALLESDSNEYIKRLVAQVGEEKAEEIQNEMDKETVQSNPPPKQLLSPPNDEPEQLVLCMEMSSKRYFWSNRRRIEQAILDLNTSMINNETYISLSEWYDAFNLEPTDISDSMYWAITETGPIKYKIGSAVSKDGIPVLTVKFMNKPLDHRW